LGLTAFPASYDPHTPFGLSGDALLPYRVESDGSPWLFIKPDGRCDLADSLAMIRSLAGQRLGGSRRGAILDLRQTDYAPTYREVQALADEAGREVGLSLALVVAGTLHTGIAHQFALLAEDVGAHVGVFTDLNAAAEWLKEGNAG
jgi:hypothetical protein